MIENSFNIKGTLYAKDTRIVPNTKKPTEPPYEFRSIKLEIKSSYTTKNKTTEVEEYHTKSTIPEFQLNKGINLDEFSIGDFIDVRFSIEGKKINENWHKTELKASYIKFADMDNKTDRLSGGKVSVSAMSNSSDLNIRETVFVAPDPNEENDPDFENLPF
jgi:hypothetical protein